jgi:hypothetical protein
MLSENLRPQIEANPDLEIIGPAQDFCYDQHGDLPAMLDAAGVSLRQLCLTFNVKLRLQTGDARIRQPPANS